MLSKTEAEIRSQASATTGMDAPLPTSVTWRGDRTPQTTPPPPPLTPPLAFVAAVHVASDGKGQIGSEAKGEATSSVMGEGDQAVDVAARLADAVRSSASSRMAASMRAGRPEFVRNLATRK